MKKIFIFFISVCSLTVLFSFTLTSSGITGTSGSPSEGACNGCHGNLSGTTISITAVPAFTNNSFDPLTNYTITITIAHPSLTRFGLNAEVLTFPGNTNSGTVSAAGPGVQIVNGPFSRKNITHTTPKSGTGSASFTFEWMSPTTGDARFYVAGNAVNLDGNTGGDSPATAVLTISNVNTAIPENKNKEDKLSGVSVFPNPSQGLTTVSYFLASEQNIKIELLDITGKMIRTLVEQGQEPGPHSNLVDLKGIERGVYFIKISANGEKISQRLISVQ